ncbi:LytTR family transcriptional regulator [Bacteroidaceae bacterium HV4-6-C5C]|nr:LytTR family transcriptional regulator [Bacteroidaceae bacterium HV4-6-C5C]
MKAHPILDYPYRWIPTSALIIFLIIIQIILLHYYAHTTWIPALVDGVTTVGWFAALTYLAWIVINFSSIPETGMVTAIVGLLLWLAGSFMICDIMVRIIGLSYISYTYTIPFRLLFGIPAWIAITLWYRLTLKDNESEESDFIPSNEQKEEPKPEQQEYIDRVTIKDGSRIHLVKVEDILYIQACGDYTTLITPTGEHIKEQTMKYFETHLPPNNFVRIHRSTIVNVAQISRVELFGKETYQVLLKNGIKLRVSLTGYRLLKERLGL